MRLLVILFIWCSCTSYAQMFPGEGDNIDYLVTSGKKAPKSAGDDDHQQVVFVLIPKNNSKPFFIRLFDPEVSGRFDEITDSTDTRTSFTVYGGPGAHSDSLSRAVSYQKRHKGHLLKKKTFGSDIQYDNKWYSIGPLNPKKGEYSEAFNGYIFKIVIDGMNGDDINLFRIFLSSSRTSNIPVSGGNIFTYEYSFRLKSKASSIAHIYPYMDKEIISITQFNFDLDKDATINLFSVKKKGEKGNVSGNGNWESSKHIVHEDEKQKCIDLQIKKHAGWHNDVVVYVMNHYNEAVPIFASPIGDIKPKFSFSSGK